LERVPALVQQVAVVSLEGLVMTMVLGQNPERQN
jgi:hypothetical protein